MGNFQDDLKKGQKGEKVIGDYLVKKGNTILEYAPNKIFKDWDIRLKDKNNKEFTVEVKTDAVVSPNVFVEYQCSGKDSGIYSTKATFYVIYNLSSKGAWLCEPEKLRELHQSGKFRVVGNVNSDNNAKGILISKNVMNEVFRFTLIQ